MQTHIILGGMAYVLRPTFEALNHMESTLDTTISTLARRLTDGELSLHELVTIIRACLEPKISEALIKEQLLESGFAHVTEAVAMMFSLVFTAFDRNKNTSPGPALSELQALCTQFPDELHYPGKCADSTFR